MASANTQCITSKQFVTILKRFDKDGNGHITKSELDAFLKAFEDEGLIESSKAVEIAEKICEQQGDDEELVTMTALAKELVPVNFLAAEFGEQQTRISSVDFMKLWDHYDADGSGYLDCIELKSFFRDILTRNRSEGDDEDPDLDKKVDHYVKTMFEMQCIKGEKVGLEEMCKFCPVEENFLEQYETFTDEEFEEIFAHYDQVNSNEVLEGCELEGFLKDLYEKKHKPGQSFEKFKAEKMKKFDKDKDQKFSKKEVKNILAKTC